MKFQSQEYAWGSRATALQAAGHQQGAGRGVVGDALGREGSGSIALLPCECGKPFQED